MASSAERRRSGSGRRRDRGGGVAAQARGDGAEAGVGQRGQQVAPGPGGVGEAVEAQRQRARRRPRGRRTRASLAVRCALGDRHGAERSARGRDHAARRVPLRQASHALTWVRLAGNVRANTGGRGDQLLNVTFFGVRGSTPCPCDANRRYGGNTSCVALEAPGHDPIVLDLGTGLRFWGETQPARRHVPRLRARHPHPLGPRAGPAVLRPRPAAPAPASTSTARRSTSEGTLGRGLRRASCARRSSRSTHRGPARRHPLPRRVGEADLERRRRQGEGAARAARRPHQRLPRRARRRHVAYMSDHQMPLDGSHDVSDGGARAVRRRRPAHPRRAVHAPRSSPAKANWGHCTVDYAVHVAEEAGRQAPGAVPPRPRPRRRRRRRDRSPTRERAAPSRHRASPRSIAAAKRASVISLRRQPPDPYASLARPMSRSLAIDSARYRQVLGHFPTASRSSPPRPTACRWAWPSARSPRCRSTRRWSAFFPDKRSSSLAEDRGGRRVLREHPGRGPGGRVPRASPGRATTSSPASAGSRRAPARRCIDGVLAWIDCDIETVDRRRRPLLRDRAGSATSSVGHDGGPLVFFRGGYGRFAV